MSEDVPYYDMIIHHYRQQYEANFRLKNCTTVRSMCVIFSFYYVTDCLDFNDASINLVSFCLSFIGSILIKLELSDATSKLRTTEHVQDETIFERVCGPCTSFGMKKSLALLKL